MPNQNQPVQPPPLSQLLPPDLYRQARLKLQGRQPGYLKSLQAEARDKFPSLVKLLQRSNDPLVRKAISHALRTVGAK